MSNDWIEWKWTPEKPYPETLETKIHVRFDDGDELGPFSVFMWYDKLDDWNNYHPDSEWPMVTHYRIAEDKP